MKKDYLSLKIDIAQAAEIAKSLYDITGEVIPLPGERDFNFKIQNEVQSYVLKISRPDVDPHFIKYQQELLNFISKNNPEICCPKVLPDLNGNLLSEITDKSGNTRFVRLLSWIDGRLWSSVNPHKEELLHSLGEQAGSITRALQGFDHPQAHRKLDWDIAQASWTNEYVYLFNNEQQTVIRYFQKIFEKLQDQYHSLRKSIVHNDANDNNIIVTDDLIHPKVKAIIDYGDAIYTQIINDLAITIAYAVMNKLDVLSASRSVIKGYHARFPILENELILLYVLVAMRLVISVTKSVINRQKEPDNDYLVISEEAAWEVLEKWMHIDENFAHYSFREACGFTPHPEEEAFITWANKQSVSVKHLIPDIKFDSVSSVDMSISSTWLGHESENSNSDLLAFKLDRQQQLNPSALIAGGYLEIRPFYSTDAYKKEGNNGPEYRTVHLGTDFWVEAQTPVYALFDGHVFSIFNNTDNKDYGPTLILKHKTNEGFVFYSLYGHLSESTLKLQKPDQFIQKGDLIAYVGNSQENGQWTPHLHFQLILDMLGNSNNFPGVAYPQQVNTWRSICPNPNVFFGERELETQQSTDSSEIISYRKRHLGKSLSFSYEDPLRIVRGCGAFLMDHNGRKYLDTVNNVAHVGHEHPQIIKAGQGQMAVLNTNTRYLHENINTFAGDLLSTFPEELSVVHFVNSGSEANELALRMTYAYTGQKDMVAVEVGYHGNTQGCIDVSSYKFDGKGGKGAPEHTHIVPLPDSYKGIYRGANTGPKYAAHIQEQIDSIQQKGRNVAGFICESIISCGGQIELPMDYLKIAYKAVRMARGLCIADEIQVGCGRVGKHFWGFQLHDVIPDIVTIGKPIGNGHPLAAVVCTQAVANAFDNGMEYFNTFGGNPVSCAIGWEVLRVIKNEKLQENALNVGNYLKKEVGKLQTANPIIGDVRGQGLFLGIELADGNKKPLTKKAGYLVNRMNDLGILMSTDGRNNNVIKIKPPLVFSIEDANELLRRLKTILTEDFMKH